MLWVVEQIHSVGEYSIPVCIETEARLYVVLVGPAPEDRGEGPPVARIVTVRTPAGAVMHAREFGARGNRDEAILMAHFDPPAPDAEYLDIELKHKPLEPPESEETADVSARVRRLK